ncbi:MAG: transcription elongation factor GreB [Gammaproteobacteria bacterium]|nr:transcription elongation factor GreB [Gammaproteobacteria bacterium]
MGRYRAPPPKSSPYITPQGHQALTEELQSLWKRRAKVTRALSAAAAEGDRSENAEYIYRKKELREIDRRIRYLQKRLPDLKVVKEIPSDTGTVFFGASVTLEDETGTRVCYRIVGADEFDPARGWISIDSPMAAALMKKSLDNEVRVTTPGGQVSFVIVDISYRQPAG